MWTEKATFQSGEGARGNTSHLQVISHKYILFYQHKYNCLRAVFGKTVCLWVIFSFSWGKYKPFG